MRRFLHRARPPPSQHRVPPVLQDSAVLLLQSQSQWGVGSSCTCVVLAQSSKNLLKRKQHSRVRLGNRCIQLGFFLGRKIKVGHDVLNGTSATGAFAFASNRVNQRFVIFSTTVFCRRRARRLVKSTLSSGWS